VNILSLRWCTQLEEVPVEIGSIPNLQTLGIRHTSRLKFPEARLYEKALIPSFKSIMLLRDAPYEAIDDIWQNPLVLFEAAKFPEFATSIGVVVEEDREIVNLQFGFSNAHVQSAWRVLRQLSFSFIDTTWNGIKSFRVQRVKFSLPMTLLVETVWL
jgi:hypothetical protein